MPMKAPPDNLSVVEYLEIIANWNLPDSGEFSDYDGHQYSYGYCYGSSGVRDYMRQVATKALELIS